MSITDNRTKPPLSVSLESRLTEEIKKSLAELRFGSILMTIHDGKVTQIETSKKIRIS